MEKKNGELDGVLLNRITRNRIGKKGGRIYDDMAKAKNGMYTSCRFAVKHLWHPPNDAECGQDFTLSKFFFRFHCWLFCPSSLWETSVLSKHLQVEDEKTVEKKRGTQVHDESDKDYIQESDTKKRERDWGVREERKHGLLRQINNRVHARTFTKRRKRVTNKHTGTSLRATSFLKIDLWKR